MGKTNKLKYTAEQMIEVLERNRGRIFLAAEELGCHEGTIRNYGKRYASVQHAIDKHRGLRLDRAENGLDDAVERGDPWAIQYMLSRLGKERGYTERQEVTGAEGGPLAIKGYMTVSPDDWPDDGTDD